VVVLATGMLAGAQGQPVQVGGYLEVKYDDVLVDLFTQGVSVIADTVHLPRGGIVAAPINATVSSDTLVIAATVRNDGYTGGLMININTSLGRAVTNGSWKWMLNPPAGWEQPAYSDDAWYPVYDQGGVRQTPGWVRDSTCIAPNDSSCPYNVFDASGARFLWAPEDLYFRRTFTVDTACSAMVWAGTRGSHIVYLDGAEVVRDSLWQYPTVLYDSLGNPDTTYRPTEHSTGGHMYLSAGSHTLGVCALTRLPLSQGTGGVLKAGVAKPIKVPQPIIEWDSLFNPDTVGWDTVSAFRPVLVCDTFWRVSHIFSDGWTAPSFNDASWWKAAVVKDQLYPIGYPSLMEFGAAVRAIWLPQTVSFRGKIALSQLPAKPGVQAPGAARRLEVGYAAGRIAVRGAVGAVFRVEVYSPDGRRVYRSAEVRSGYCQIGCDGWAKGSYIVRVSSGRSVVTRPLTVTR